MTDEETIEDYSLKCPYCGVYQDPSGGIKDCYDDVWTCESCDKQFIATVTTSTLYIGVTVRLYNEREKRLWE